MLVLDHACGGKLGPKSLNHYKYTFGFHQYGRCSSSVSLHRVDALTQVYVRFDQPQTALQQYSQAAARQPGQVELLLGQARVHDALNDLEQGVKLYKQVHPAFPLCVWPNSLYVWACLW